VGFHYNDYDENQKVLFVKTIGRWNNGSTSESEKGRRALK
jgi:hypothetical protein